jgi:hypothetical protein
MIYLPLLLNYFLFIFLRKSALETSLKVVETSVPALFLLLSWILNYPNCERFRVSFELWFSFAELLSRPQNRSKWGVRISITFVEGYPETLKYSSK